MDEELYDWIRRARRGDREAFAELVARYKGPVFREAYGLLGERMEAEDAAQEAFVKAFYSLPGLASEFAFAAWLTRIVVNLCRDRLKRRDSEQRASGELLEAAAGAGTDPAEKVILDDALRRLSAEHREAIVLHDVQGYRYEEIAQLLDIPLGTVKSRLFAARLALRKQLKKGDE